MNVEIYVEILLNVLVLNLAVCTSTSAFEFVDSKDLA